MPEGVAIHGGRRGSTTQAGTSTCLVSVQKGFLVSIRLTTREQCMDRRIKAAIKIIHIEVYRNIPVSEVAEQVRLSISHFIRVFKAETSLSPKQYVRCVRMKQAEVLLDDSFLSVKEIAVSVGFGDRSHFSRDFKRLRGQAPTNFRDRERDLSDRNSRD